MSKAPSTRKRRSPLLWVILAGVLIFASFAIFALSGREQSQAVSVAKVEQRSIIASISESGVIEPVNEVKIAADVSGEVVQLDVKEGMQVKRGDMLVSIRPDNYQSALELAQSSLNASVASELNAKSAQEQAYQRYLSDSANFRRQDDLYAKRVISKAEWDAAKLQIDIARSAYRGAIANVKGTAYQTDSRRASLKTAQSDLRKTTIFASMDGILTRQGVKLGERVVGTAQMAGTELFRIADLSRMQVVVDINENDIVHVKIGDSAYVEVDAFEGRKFKGRVTEIAYSASESALGATDQITSFEVKVEIDPASYLRDPQMMAGVLPNQSPFRPGMSAQVEIFTERADNVTAVPIQSVTIRRIGEDEDAPPQEVVFVLDKSMKAVQRQVKTGISDDSFIAILEGLKPGEEIIIGPYKALSKTLEDGTKVVLATDEQAKAAKKAEAEDAE
jgi:HlyD family secretion protein